MSSNAMVQRKLSTAVVALWVGLLCQLCQAHAQVRYPADFSADYAGFAPKTVLGGRYYTSRGRTRTELTQEGKLTKIIIADAPHRSIWQLDPQKKIASDMSKLYDTLGRYYEAVDPNNPCSTFIDNTCSKVGIEMINGRQTQRWHLTNQYGGSMDLWVDPKLRLEIKMLDASNGIGAELRNIKEGPQPDSIFQVPSDYQKVEGFGPVQSDR